MTAFFLRIYDFFLCRRRLCFGLIFATMAVLMAMMATLRYNENIYDFLPISGDEQKAINLYQDISGGQSIFALFSVPEDGELLATEAVDCFAAKVMAGGGSQHISEITTQIDFDKYTGITDFIYKNIPVMLVDSDYVRMDRLLSSPDFADRQLANDLEMILMPSTGFLTPDIAYDPLGLFTPAIERLQARQRELPVEIDDGYLFTPGKQYAVAMLKSPYGAMESAQNSLLVSYVDSVAKATMKIVPEVKIGITGSPVIAVGNAAQIKADSIWAISIAVTLILLLLFFAFRKVKHHLLIIISVLFGWLFAMGFISVLRSDVSLIVLGIGSIIIGIAVNYPLHFIAHTNHGGTIREVLKDMIPPLLIGNITTVGAFASLIPLNAPALRDLGLFAAFMLVGTILFVLIFLPHLVKAETKSGKEHLLFARALSRVNVGKYKFVPILVVLLTLVFGYFSFDTTFDTNIQHINYMTDEQKELLGSLHASAGINDTTNVYIVTEGQTWDEAISERTCIAPLLDSLRKTGVLNSYSDVTDFVCSTTEQERRIERWNTFWEMHSDIVKNLLREKAPQYGFRANAFSPFSEILGATYTPHSFAYFEPVVSVLLSNSFSTSTGSPSVVDIISPTKNYRSALEATLNDSLGTHGYAFDFTGMNSAVAESLSSDFNYIGFACGFIVFLFLWFSFGRLELALLSFLPMAVGWIWILGIMGIFNIQFNIVNIILATFIFGQGDDYTIFMTEGLIDEYAYNKRVLPSFKNSIIISALIMFIGMGSLIVARHPALHSLAEVTIVGMLTVVLMAFYLPPFVFRWIIMNEGRPRRVPGTLDQVFRTFYCACVYLFQISYGCVCGLIAKYSPWRKRELERWFHGIIYRSMRVDINHIWGVKTVVTNPFNEDFSRGSIMICNHQSMLDPIFVLAQSPNIVVVMGHKVWDNPIVHKFFTLARYINIHQPMDALKQQIAAVVKDGYNVMLFPEGKRSDAHVMRFHKGAFYLAEELGTDILPVYIHGTGHVMPRSSGLSTRGRIDVSIGQRIPNDQLHLYGDSQLGMAKNFRQLYKQQLNKMSREIEDTHYFHDYIIYKYLYKGFEIERETRLLLRKYNDFSDWIDDYHPSIQSSNSVSIINARRGQFSLMFALVHPDINVHSYTFDREDMALAMACTDLPNNLHIHYCNKDEISIIITRNDNNFINLTDII